MRSSVPRKLAVAALVRCSLLPSVASLLVFDDGWQRSVANAAQDPKAPSTIEGVKEGKTLKAGADDCELQHVHKYPIGLANRTWLPIAFEIEFFSKSERASKNSKTSYGQQMSLFKEKVLDGIEYMGSCSPRMFELSDTEEQQQDAWLFELEKNKEEEGPLMYEATTPIALLEDEAEIAISQTGVMAKYFKKVAPPAFWVDGERPWRDDPPGLHVHVDSRCLMDDERRLAALLLTWEKFGKAIYNATGVLLHNDTKKSSQKAEAIQDKSEMLLNNLLLYLNSSNGSVEWSVPPPNESLTHLFNRLEPANEMEGDKTEADGFRRFEVNVCHLLNVKCAHDLPKKNEVPKFGGLEFRGFDPLVGEPLRLVVSLVVRLVQFYCSANMDEQLLYLSAWDGVNHAQSLEDLWLALDMDPVQFQAQNGTLFTDNFGGVPDTADGAKATTTTVAPLLESEDMKSIEQALKSVTDKR